MNFEENYVYVFTKNGDLLFIFDGENDGEGEDSLRNQMVAPTVRIAQNGESTLTFQILKDSWAWKQIENPTNIYLVNDRYYTPLTDAAYTYTGESSTTIVNVTCVELWYKLSRKFTQAYNCGLYCTAKATFSRYTTDGAVFTIKSTDCAIPGDAISSNMAWTQVKLWTPKDSKGNELSYTILKTEEDKPEKWENVPGNVVFSSFSVSGTTATVTLRSRAKVELTQTFDYNSSNNYTLKKKPFPNSIKEVKVNSTITTTSSNLNSYQTSDKTATFTYTASTGVVKVNYSKKSNETINYIAIIYEYYELGDIETGATCTFAYGAEVVDEHTFIILPKADTKYKLTIDGVQYEDSQVKDSRGVLMPRGSAGYALWAALKNSGWKLGICDVIAKGFDTSIDYGCFNIESDQKDVLYIVQYIQQLYGGILDWDSKNKLLNYRAENNDDYQSYKDGFNEWTGYEFRAGKNLKDQPEITVDNDIITRAYLLGYGGLNVKKVNNSKTYVDDFSFTNDIYEGYLEQPLIYDTRDDGGMKQLLYWGKKELSKMCKPRKHIELNVYDIRTIKGYEHEVFDINDVVRCYYMDTETNEETYEEKRVVEFEYAVFNRYDATVTLGDKVQNLQDIFKLVYNMTMDSPSTNASGEISDKDILVDQDISLNKRLDLIIQTTTSNTDAIAGLMMQTTNLYASLDLFTSFERKTDELLTQTYAGLKFYADSVGSSVELIARGLYEQSQSDLNAYKKEVTAGFTAIQNEQYALTQQFSSYRTETNKAISENLASMKTYADEKSAQIELTVSSYQSQTNRTISNNLASMKMYADDLIANIELSVKDSGGQTTLTMTSGGIYIDSVSFDTEPYGYDDLYNAMDEITNSSFRYSGPTYLDGSMIAAGTVIAGDLMGGTISILDSSETVAAYFYPRGASSYNGRALELDTGALSMHAIYGDIFLEAGGGRSWIQIHGDGRISLVGTVTVNGVPLEIQ